MARVKGYPSNFFEANEIIHRISGLWLFDREQVPRRWKIAKDMYTFSVYGVTLCFILTEFIMFKETVKDIAKFITHFEMLLPNLLAFMKMVTLRLQHGRLQRIMGILQDKRYYYDTVGDFNPRQIFFQAKRNNQLVSKLLLGLYSFVGISAYISSKVSISFHMKENHFTPNSSCYDFLVYYFYIPFYCDTKRKCEGVILFMGLSLIVCSWIVASHDALYCALVNCLHTHFVILTGALKTIRKRVLLRLNLSQDFQIFHDEEFSILENALYKELRHLTKHLIILLEAAHDIEAAFNLVLLVQVIISLISFASVLFVAASVPFASPEFFTQLEYFSSLLVQLGLFCWFGDRIRTSSQDILYALYDCDWFSSSKRFKSALIVTMCRMQRPPSLTFGKFGPLTITSLVTVCKSSFSYYTVFKTVNE
nr:odorant receptor [Semanotus bifasciatus]